MGKIIYFKMFKSSLFLILCLLPIAFSSDRLAKLEQTDAGKTVLNTLLIQTKLHGVNAEAIKTVLKTTADHNDAGIQALEKQGNAEKASCEADAKSLAAGYQDAVQRRFTLERNTQTTSLLRSRKVDYSRALEAEVAGYNTFIKDIEAGQAAWNTFYQAMTGSIESAQKNLGQIRGMVEKSNPHNAASFVEVSSKESLVNEIKSNLEYRFYDTLGIKPILTGLVEVASKDMTPEQFYNVSKTMDLLSQFLVDRRNNLIEDNEYETTLNGALSNSLTASVTATNSEIQIVKGLVNSLSTRLGLLGNAVRNAVQLATYARNVMDARAAICVNFAQTSFVHLRRYNAVRLTIAELSNTFDEEYKDFESFLQKRMTEQ